MSFSHGDTETERYEVEGNDSSSTELERLTSVESGAPLAKRARPSPEDSSPALICSLSAVDCMSDSLGEVTASSPGHGSDAASSMIGKTEPAVQRSAASTSTIGLPPSHGKSQDHGVGGGSLVNIASAPARLPEEIAQLPAAPFRPHEAAVGIDIQGGGTIRGNGTPNSLNEGKAKSSGAVKLENAREGVAAMLRLASQVTRALETRRSNSSTTIAGRKDEHMPGSAHLVAELTGAGHAQCASGPTDPWMNTNTSTEKEGIAVAALVTKFLGALDASVAAVPQALKVMPQDRFNEVCEKARRAAHTTREVLMSAASSGAAAASTPAALAAAKELTRAVPKGNSRNSRGMKQVAADVRDAVATAGSLLDPYAMSGVMSEAAGVADCELPMALETSDADASDGRSVVSADTDGATGELANPDHGVMKPTCSVVDRLVRSRAEIAKSLEMAAKIAGSVDAILLGPESDRHLATEGPTDRARRARSATELVTKLMGPLDASTTLTLRALREAWTADRMSDVIKKTMQHAHAAQHLLTSVKNGAYINGHAEFVAAQAKAPLIHVPVNQVWGSKKLPTRVRNAAGAAMALLSPFLDLCDVSHVPDVDRTEATKVKPWRKQASDSSAAEMLDSATTIDKLEIAKKGILDSLQLAAEVAQAPLTPHPSGSSGSDAESVDHEKDAERGKAAAELVTRMLEPLVVQMGVLLRSLEEEWPPAKIKATLQSTRREAYTAHAFLESVRDGAAVDDQEALLAAEVKGATLAPFPPHAWGAKRVVERIQAVSAAACDVLKPYSCMEAPVAEMAPLVPVESVAAESSAQARRHWLKKASSSRSAETLDSERAEEALQNARGRLLSVLRFASAKRACYAAEALGPGDRDSGSSQRSDGGRQDREAVAALVTELLDPLVTWMSEALTSVQEEWEPARIKELFFSIKQKAYTTEALLQSVRGGAAMDDEHAIKDSKERGARLPPPPSHAWGIKKLVEKIESTSKTALALLDSSGIAAPYTQPVDVCEAPSSVSVSSQELLMSRWVKKASDSRFAETLDAARTEEALQNARGKLIGSTQLASRVLNSHDDAESTHELGNVETGSSGVSLGDSTRARDVAMLVSQMLEPLNVSVMESIIAIRQEQDPAQIKALFHNSKRKACTAEALLQSIRDGAAVGDEQAIAEAKVIGARQSPPPPHAWGAKKLVEKLESVASTAKSVLEPHVTICSQDGLMTENLGACSSDAPIATCANEISPVAQEGLAVNGSVPEEERMHTTSMLAHLEGAAMKMEEAVRFVSSFSRERSSAPPDAESFGRENGTRASSMSAENSQQSSDPSGRCTAVAKFATKLLEALRPSMALAIWSVRDQWAPDRVQEVFHSTGQEAVKVRLLLRSVATGAAVDDDEALRVAEEESSALAPPSGSSLESDLLVERVTGAANAAEDALRTTAAAPAAVESRTDCALSS